VMTEKALEGMLLWTFSSDHREATFWKKQCFDFEDLLIICDNGKTKFENACTNNRLKGIRYEVVRPSSKVEELMGYVDRNEHAPIKLMEEVHSEQTSSGRNGPHYHVFLEANNIAKSLGRPYDGEDEEGQEKSLSNSEDQSGQEPVKKAD